MSNNRESSDKNQHFQTNPVQNVYHSAQDQPQGILKDPQIVLPTNYEYNQFMTNSVPNYYDTTNTFNMNMNGAVQNMNQHVQQMMERQQQQIQQHQEQHKVIPMTIPNGKFHENQRNISNSIIEKDNINAKVKLETMPLDFKKINASKEKINKITKNNEPPKKPSGKTLTQSDLDLRLLSNNVDKNNSLKELSNLIRRLEAEESSNKKGKQQVERPFADPNGNIPKLDTEQFSSLLGALPKSKKLQLFGIAWLKKACKIAPEGHIPRNRMFAKYVTVCADFGVGSLSPALFGKLIRMIYPCITIHRYGVRGQSKYHYCGISLIESNNSTSNNGNATVPSSGSSTPNPYINYHRGMIGGSELSNSEVSSPLRSVFDVDSSMNSPIYSATELSPVSASSSYSIKGNNQPPTKSELNNVNKFLGEYPIKFLPELWGLLDECSKSDFSEINLTLPPIENYLPNNVNLDIATTLSSLYKSYCFAIFESFRYLKINDLNKALGSFLRSLSNPVFKLYVSDIVLSWLLRCDILLYENILKMLFKIIVRNNINDKSEILEALRNISNNYIFILSDSLTNLPEKLTQTKLNLAKKFTKLLRKIISICTIGKSIDSIFSNINENCSLFCKIWSENINPEQLAEDNSSLYMFFTNNSFIKANFIKVFSKDIPNLLKSTISPNVDLEQVAITWLNYFCQLASHVSRGPNNQNNNLKRIAGETFLLILNSLFDSALNILQTVNHDIFLNFWNLKSWILEWLHWYGEFGGLLVLGGFNYKQPTSNSTSRSISSSTNGGRLSRVPSRKRFREENVMINGNNTNVNNNNNNNNNNISNSSSYNNLTDQSLFQDVTTIIHENSNNNSIANNQYFDQQPPPIIQVSPRKKIKLLDNNQEINETNLENNFELKLENKNQRDQFELLNMLSRAPSNGQDREDILSSLLQ